MFLSTATAASVLALLPCLSLALPQATSTAAASTPTHTPLNTTRSYYLKTQLSPRDQGRSRAHLDHLYLYSYHTGAGLNDVALNASKTHASKGFLNVTATVRFNYTTNANETVPVTYQEFDLGNTWPYGMALGYAATYAAWEPVTVNAGYGSGGFSVNATGLQVDEQSTGFGGWLACDWWHGVPQLFWMLKYYHDVIPSSCATVNLVPEYI
ncbi:hypothetical protein LTR60_000672 [Cryomyces antarcticus]|nr:hypothetical protein LTR60_000672 [Cryomyces antarcticus]